jgi:hypothetical protein
MNFKTSQFRVPIFRKVSIRSLPLRFSVKFNQNFQNTHVFIFLKKKIIKNLKDSGMSILQISLNYNQKHLNPRFFFS